MIGKNVKTGLCIAAMMAVPMLLLSMTSAKAQDGAASSCAKVGDVASFSDIPTDADDLKPSRKSELANIGRLARTNDCTVRIRCITESKSETDRTAAYERCAVARRAVYIGGRLPSWGSDRVKISRQSAGSGRKAGNIYLSFQ